MSQKCTVPEITDRNVKKVTTRSLTWWAKPITGQEVETINQNGQRLHQDNKLPHASTGEKYINQDTAHHITKHVVGVVGWTTSKQHTEKYRSRGDQWTQTPGAELGMSCNSMSKQTGNT